MASFGSSYAASPVLTMTPHSVHHNPFDNPVLNHQSSSFGASTSWAESPLQSSCVAAGRKRSRDEAAVNLDAPEKMVEIPIIKESEEEWVYGPGMTLIKKSSGYAAVASSQSGTWLEEKAAQAEAQQTEAAILAQEQASQARPSLRSNKSQRLELAGASTLPPTADGFQSNRSSPSRDIANTMAASSDAAAQPVVDDFTLHLGIGWSRISDEVFSQQAARGWARYIENHYHISDVNILLESRGLQSYLVKANEGFFLFAENLRNGRLVSTDPERALHNLKTSPPTFDGLDTLNATDTPKPLDTPSDVFINNTTESHAIDMDMS